MGWPASRGEGAAEGGAAFPGTDAVDLLCLDGYNWGDGQGHTWKNPEDIFARGLDQVRALDDRHPIVIAETASVEGPRSGADKADWIHQLANYLARQAQV